MAVSDDFESDLYAARAALGIGDYQTALNSYLSAQAISTANPDMMDQSGRQLRWRSQEIMAAITNVQKLLYGKRGVQTSRIHYRSIDRDCD